MEKYKINIASFGSDWSDEKITEGTVVSDEGVLKINYMLDGDKCTLSIKDGTVIQERIGDQNVYMQFEEGKKSQCVFGSGGFSGSFEILTKKIKFISGKGGYKLTLDYLSGSDREPISLTLTALNNSWGIK